LIHVIDFEGNVVDFFGKRNDAILSANYERKNDEGTESEILTLLISTKASEQMQEYRRLLIQDETEAYREFVIERCEKENNGYSVIEATASYFIDIAKARSIAKGTLEKMTLKEMVYNVLRGTGWELGNVDWSGVKTISWDAERTPYELLKQICTAFDVEIDFTYEMNDKGIGRRLVHLYKKKALFKGKEIKKGKDLLSLKRISDATEVVTAVIALGPEKEDGSRLRIEVTDDDAQSNFGIDKRYIWGIYEPESEDATMTSARLTSLAKTHLNKVSKVNVSYEVDALDIRKQFPHEVTRFGDIARIKDRDFTPPLYAEAEVTGIEHDLISDERKYTFGTPKEFVESDLRRYFTERLAMLQQMMKDDILNIDQIMEKVVITVDTKIEETITTGETPPETPVTGQLWYDTSNPNNAVLREYQNGEWVNSTTENPGDIGTLSRAQILYRELQLRYNVTLEQNNLLNEEYNKVLNDQYLTDQSVKDALTQAYLDAQTKYNSATSEFALISEDAATNLNILPIQTAVISYYTSVNELAKQLQLAQKSIQDRLALLQSQYTDERVKQIFSEIASSTGLTYDEATNTLTGAVGITDQQVTDISNKVQENLAGQYVTTTTYSTDQQGIVTDLQNQRTEMEQMSNQINLEVSDSKLNTTMKTLTEAVSAIQLLADGINMTSGEDGIITSVSISPEGYLVKSDKIQLVGDVYMQDGLVRVSDLKIGGEDKTGRIEIKNAANEVFFGLDTEQAAASELSIGTLRVEKVVNNDIVTQSSENMTFYVSNTGDNENDGLTLDTAFATVERALQEIPIVYNGECTIYLRTLDSAELIEVKGYMGKGKIIFAGCTSTGSPSVGQIRNSIAFNFAGNTIDNYIQNIFIETERGTTGIVANGASVNAINVNINGGGGGEKAVEISRNAYFEWRTGESSNVSRSMTCASGSNAFLKDVNLYANDFGIVAAYASQVEANNVKIKSTTATSAFAGSFIGGSITNMTTTSTTPVAPPPTIKTVTLTSNSAGHYYKNYNNLGWNGTFMKGYPIQGTWNPYGERMGFWFFGNQFDRFIGKTIKKVRVYIGRSSTNMQGYTGSRKATLRMHAYSTKPSTAPATSNATDSKAIMLEMGESKWVDVTSIFGTMINESKWKGFAVNTDSTSAYEYMAMKPTLKVEVTYVV